MRGRSWSIVAAGAVHPFVLPQEMIMKARIAAAAVAAIASLASFATVTSAAGLTPTTTAMPEGHAHAIGPRDPYTDGGKASRFDVYADTANVTDRRDPYTDGAHS